MNKFKIIVSRILLIALFTQSSASLTLATTAVVDSIFCFQSSNPTTSIYHRLATQDSENYPVVTNLNMTSNQVISQTIAGIATGPIAGGNIIF